MSELQSKFGNLPIIYFTDALKHTMSFVKNDYKHVLEFGVYRGESTEIIRRKFDNSYTIYAFDSFQGLPEDWVNTVCKKNCFTTYGQVPNIQGINWMVGWFSETLPKYLENPDKIAFLNIDCDLYSSTTEILEALNPYICENTVIHFDDWLYKANTPDLYDYRDDGEKRAFYEWVSKYNRKFELINYPTDQINECKGVIIK